MKRIFTRDVVNGAVRSLFFATFLFLVAYGVRGNILPSETVVTDALPVFRGTVLSSPVMSPAPSVSAESACVINLDTGALLYDKNATARRPIASTTKIMTAVVVLENAELGKTIEVGEGIRRAYGSSVYLRVGERLSVEELLYGLLLESGNDAAIALAEGVAGSEEKFVALMNEKAKELGLGTTTFKNPHGLTQEGHESCAYDLARLTAYALENEDFKRICSSVTYSTGSGSEARRFVNHNKLLRTYSGAIGVKTGYTEAAGRCLVSAAQRDGTCFICVTLDDRDDWRDHGALFDCAFENYLSRRYFEEGQVALSFGGVLYRADKRASLLFETKGGKGEFTLTLRPEDSRK